MLESVRYHGIPGIKTLRETEPIKLPLVRQVCGQGFSLTDMCTDTAVYAGGWVGRKGACLQVTFDVVNWEKMGPFSFFKQHLLRMSLVSVA